MSLISTSFDFGKNSFLKVLSVLKENQYRFISFCDVIDSISGDEKVCLMRHDVDISMDYAVELAKLEYTQGVRACYFVMLRSPLYNLFSRHNAAMLKRLISLGHEIGLHFDARCPPSPGKSLESELTLELDILSQLTGKPVFAFSYHQPNDEIIQKKLVLSGVINTYNSDQLLGFKYISDSNREWREMTPIQLAESGMKRIHILLHPIWWICQHRSICECWDSAISNNFYSEQTQLLSTERAYGSRRKILIKSD